MDGNSKVFFTAEELLFLWNDRRRDARRELQYLLDAVGIAYAVLCEIHDLRLWGL